jgi:hypothetical protein
MAFFVEETGQKQSEDTVYEQLDRLDLEWLVIGKRSGLSFMEMNELRVRDLIAYVDIYTRNKTPKPNMATQAEIDRFFAG